MQKTPYWELTNTAMQKTMRATLRKSNGDGCTRRHLKSEVARLQTLSRLYHLVQFVKFWQNLWS